MSTTHTESSKVKYFKIEKLVVVEKRFQTFVTSEACQQQMEDCDADHQLSVEEEEDSKVETFGRSDLDQNGGGEKEEEKEEVEAENDKEVKPADEGDKKSKSSVACLSNVGIEKIPSMEVVDDLVQMENSEDEHRSVGKEEEGGGQNEQESQEERTQVDDNELNEKEKELGKEKVKGKEGESYEHELNEMEEEDNEKQGMEDKKEDEQNDGKEENAEEGRRLIIMLGETDFTSFTSCSLASSGTLINVSTAQQGEGGDGDEEQRGADKADADVRGGVSGGLEDGNDLHPAGDALKCILHISKHRKFQSQIVQQRR